MRPLTHQFRQRSREVRKHLAFLRHLDSTLQVPPSRAMADPLSLQVLKAGIFLHLYNLVEATITICLQAIGDAIRDEHATYKALNPAWRRAWVKQQVKFNDVRLAIDTRLTAALEACDHIAENKTIDFAPTANTGSLDDRRIEELAHAFGISLTIRPNVQKAIKHRVLNDSGALGLIRVNRNKLAHGLESFAECGREFSVKELQRFAVVTILYLADVTASFESFISGRRFAA